MLGGYLLTLTGGCPPNRLIFMRGSERLPRKQESWKHPVVGYALSYHRAIELEARLLEKEWCGMPGLFAKMRLRG